MARSPNRRKRTTLVDAQKMARLHETFDVPPEGELKAIEEGDLVKITAEPGERFWVQVTEHKGKNLKGEIRNELVLTEEHGLSSGKKVAFQERHVYDIAEQGSPKFQTALGAGLGSLLGASVGRLIHPGVALLGSVLGGGAGGYVGAPADRKRRGTVGGAVGGIFTPIGATVGGAIAGAQPDRLSNPEQAREITHSKPYNVRRYPGSGMYYCRDIHVDGQRVGTWTEWAKGWRDDWKRIRKGESGGLGGFFFPWEDDPRRKPNPEVRRLRNSLMR